MRVGIVRAADIAAHPTHRMDAEYWLDQQERNQGADMPAPPRLTPYGVILKYMEEEGVAWSGAHADGLLDRLRREDYQVTDGARATDQPCDRTSPAQLKNKDRIVTGLHGQWLADVVGVHENVDGEEVMVVMVVPAEAVFEVAGKTP